MELKEIRHKNNLTQLEAAEIVGLPLRTYIRYERDEQYGNILKRKKIIEILNDKFEITEEKGVLTISEIKQIVIETIDKEFKGKVDFCYLFGSYAKGYASDKSDVDLCMSANVHGFEYFGLVELLRENLHKVVEVILTDELKNNTKLLNEIMKDGIKIYG